MRCRWVGSGYRLRRRRTEAAHGVVDEGREAAAQVEHRPLSLVPRTVRPAALRPHRRSLLLPRPPQRTFSLARVPLRPQAAGQRATAAPRLAPHKKSYIAHVQLTDADVMRSEAAKEVLRLYFFRI